MPPGRNSSSLHAAATWYATPPPKLLDAPPRFQNHCIQAQWLQKTRVGPPHSHSHCEACRSLPTSSLFLCPRPRSFPKSSRFVGPALQRLFRGCASVLTPLGWHTQVLVKNNISSVPVMDVETNQFSGLIDMIGTERRSLVFFSPTGLVVRRAHALWLLGLGRSAHVGRRYRGGQGAGRRAVPKPGRLGDLHPDRAAGLQGPDHRRHDQYVPHSPRLRTELSANPTASRSAQTSLSAIPGRPCGRASRSRRSSTCSPRTSKTFTAFRLSTGYDKAPHQLIKTHQSGCPPLESQDGNVVGLVSQSRGLSLSNCMCTHQMFKVSVDQDKTAGPA